MSFPWWTFSLLLPATHGHMKVLFSAENSTPTDDYSVHEIRHRIGIGVSGIGVVISSYCHDDLRFLNDLPCDRFQIYVYSKCEAISEYKFAHAPSQRECITISEYNNALNGRDSESHLYHIVKRYHALEPFSLFLQGNTRGHGQNLHRNIMAISDMFSASGNSSLGFHSFHLSLIHI